MIADSKYDHLLISHFNNSGMAISIYDVRLRKLIFSNGKLHEALGHEDREINVIPELNTSCYHKDDISLLKKLMISINGTEPREWEHIYRLRDNTGSWAWIYSRFSLNKIFNIDLSMVLFIVSFKMDLQKMRGMQVRNLLSELIYANNQDMLESLTVRERQVLNMVARGKSYSKIATELNIRPDTVNKHRKNIQNKLKLNSIAKLTCFAKESGLV